MAEIIVGENTIHYEQAGTGPNLVLLPTLLAEMSVYDGVINELSLHFRVTRMNFPGFGSSTGPIDQNIEAYADLISAAIKELSLPPDTHLIGNGFGGFVAGTIAIHHGTIIDKLILVDTGAAFPDAAKEPLRILANKAKSEGMGSVLDLAIKRMFPEDFIINNKSIIDTRKEYLSKADPELFANAALGLTSLDNNPKLEKINNPTLIVVGLADATTPPQLSYDLHKGINNSQLIELPGIGHCPQLQDPSKFLDSVIPFLNS